MPTAMPVVLRRRTAGLRPGRGWTVVGVPHRVQKALPSVGEPHCWQNPDGPEALITPVPSTSHPSREGDVDGRITQLSQPPQ